MKMSTHLSLNDYKFARRPGHIIFFSSTFTILFVKLFHFHSFVTAAVALFFRWKWCAFQCCWQPLKIFPKSKQCLKGKSSFLNWLGCIVSKTGLMGLHWCTFNKPHLSTSFSVTWNNQSVERAWSGWFRSMLTTPSCMFPSGDILGSSTLGESSSSDVWGFFLGSFPPVERMF